LAYTEKRGKSWRVRWLLPEPGPDGKPRYDSKSGFPTKSAAKKHGEDQESDIRNKRWVDPARGSIHLTDYYNQWLPAQDHAPSTGEFYDSLFRNHLLPRWGGTEIREISPFDVDRMEKELRAARSASTADGVMTLLRMLMEDAVWDKRLSSSPVRPKRRRGKVEASTAREGIAVDLETVEAIRKRLPAPEALLVLTAAFTGMRWGEAIGMRRKYLSLDGTVASYFLDAKDGAVHENNKGERSYGPTKTRKERTVELPGFLALQLAEHLEAMPKRRQELFVDQANELHRRSNFRRRLWRPACDGWPARTATRGRSALEAAPPIHPELVFHDLRHSHETWLSEDGVERVARDERLGHVTPGMEGTYGHATPKMRANILMVLELRWETCQTRVGA
jgi:integrase